MAVLPAVVLTLGLFNWCTTCCCGNSMILEIMHGSCDYHHEGHGIPGHSGHDSHSCHKRGGDTFLEQENPDTFFSPALLNLPADSTYPLSGTLSPVAARWTIPRGAPPEISLVTQRWLI